MKNINFRIELDLTEVFIIETYPNRKFTVVEGHCNECFFINKNECCLFICDDSERKDKTQVCYISTQL